MADTAEVSDAQEIPYTADVSPVMDGIENFRGIGGLPTTDARATATGLLWRSGHLARATDADLARLHALGMRTVVDLRTDHDLAADGPDRRADGIDEVAVPISDDSGLGAEIRALITGGDLASMREAWGDGRALAISTAGARRMATDPGRVAAFRRVVDVVTDPDRWPVVWHCSAGKDRAGWTATVVLLALGVERDAIVVHYLESNRGAARSAAAMVDRGWMSEEALELAGPFMEVAPGYIEAQLAAVDDHWGGASSMLRDGFGFTDQRLADLRDRLLD